MSVVASMFPPESTTATGSGARHPPCEERREADGTCTLDEELRPLDAEDERLGDLLVGDGTVSSRSCVEDATTGARPGA